MPTLYDYQKDAVKQLLDGKHFVISGTGCLAKGTPVRMSDGTFKSVDDLKDGDMVLGYDEYANKFKPSEVECVLRTSHKPKPMIELEYDGEKITTTYDHPFYNGEGFYPLYQLIWGALEASQRVQLELLCKQYGATFNHTLSRGKHSCCNETCERCERLFKNSNEWKDGKGSQNSCGELAKKSIRLGLCEPYKHETGRQQSGEPRMVFCEIQRLVLNEERFDKKTSECKQYESSDNGTENVFGEILQGEYSTTKTERRETQGISETKRNVSRYDNGENTHLGDWKIKIKVSEPYYSICLRTAPHTYCIGRKHCFVTHNSGKGAMAVVWAKAVCNRNNKKNVLVVTTASKSRTTDFQDDADLWNGMEWRKSLSSFSVISWHKLAAFVAKNSFNLKDYVVIFDEVAKSSAGVSSQMGRAFLKITKATEDWAGFTATPGDTWLKFYPYFQACGLVRCKTAFMSEFAIVATYKGFPEIVGWRAEDKMKEMWKSISTAPDTSKMLAELPEETHKTIRFNAPTTYKKTLKTRVAPNGDLLDTSGALCAELRRQCFTNDKKQWIKDFVEGLGTNAVMFYNFIQTGDELEETILKALPKGARVWRIDGKRHEIPTAETIGRYDVVICQWQSGSEALNFQFMNYWVAVELCYSYSTAVQARGRIKRIGQKKHMNYQYLLTNDTIEQDILKCLHNKSQFSDEIWLAELKERSNR